MEVRKEASLSALRTESDLDAIAVIAADKLDNLRSLVETLGTRGEKETWEIFNAPKNDQQWYYRAIAQEILAKNEESRLSRTLHAEVHQVFPGPGGETSFASTG